MNKELITTVEAIKTAILQSHYLAAAGTKHGVKFRQVALCQIWPLCEEVAFTPSKVREM